MQLADGDTGRRRLLRALPNTNPYTYPRHPAAHVAPDATLDRGLALATFRTLSAVPFLRLVAAALGYGRPVGAQRALDLRDDLDGFTIRALAGALPVQVDGEYLGEVDEAVFVHERDALLLVMPGV